MLSAAQIVFSSTRPGAGAASWRDGVPNALTAARVAAIPVLVATFYNRQGKFWQAKLAVLAAQIYHTQVYLVIMRCIHSNHLNISAK